MVSWPEMERFKGWSLESSQAFLTHVSGSWWCICGWDLSWAVSWHLRVAFHVLLHTGRLWVSTQEVNCALQTGILGGSGGSCITFYDLTSEVAKFSCLCNYVRGGNIDPTFRWKESPSHTGTCEMGVVAATFVFYFIFYLHLRTYLLILERGEERVREKHWCERDRLIGCLSYAPGLGTEPAT